MLDYRYTPDDRPPTYVADLSDEDIALLLREGVEVVYSDISETADSVLERLRIEQLIRSLDLRDEVLRAKGTRT